VVGLTALAAACGAGIGFGLVAIVVGMRGVTIPASLHYRARESARRMLPRLTGAVGAGIAVGALTGWPIGALFAAAGAWTLPKLLGGAMSRARSVARIEAVAAWTEMLRDTLAGAAGLEQAIQATAPVAPAPIRPEVIALAARLSSDRLVPALQAFASDLADPTADLVVAALLLAAEHEARQLGPLLGSLAQAAREQVNMRLRVEAGRARTRTSVRVVVGATLFMAGALVLLNRTYLAPYDSAAGELVLALVGACFAAAFVWLTRLAQPAERDRVLDPGRTARGVGV
jgi:Flp pilus assembly protein TadB